MLVCRFSDREMYPFPHAVEDAQSTIANGVCTLDCILLAQGSKEQVRHYSILFPAFSQEKYRRDLQRMNARAKKAIPAMMR